MDEETKELIALAASCAANCLPSLEHHLPRARAAGVTPARIREAMRIARTIRLEAAHKWDERAAALLGSHTVTIARRPAGGQRSSTLPAN